MRGEHVTQTSPTLTTSGSAPHARGTQPWQLMSKDEQRFSPACAGNTTKSSSSWSDSTVQPRMRGEHGRLLVSGVKKSGSAPHARGTPNLTFRRVQSRRFSPACAGNTAAASCSLRPPSVQPRMRGEHRRRASINCLKIGSAPHARGTRDLHPATTHLSRFSPACAGNTALSKSEAISIAVQPRMRGEHLNASNFALTKLGSAPHARGTRANIGPSRIPKRFSPACAGNTVSLDAAVIQRTVQPRMRGEHRLYSLVLAASDGSAPHARGTLLLGFRPVVDFRFSPACAGNTLNDQSIDSGSPVQPRMRGEHAIS